MGRTDYERRKRSAGHGVRCFGLRQYLVRCARRSLPRPIATSRHVFSARAAVGGARVGLLLVGGVEQGGGRHVRGGWCTRQRVVRTRPPLWSRDEVELSPLPPDHCCSLERTCGDRNALTEYGSLLCSLYLKDNHYCGTMCELFLLKAYEQLFFFILLCAREHRDKWL